MIGINVWITTAVSLLTMSLWALLNRPEQEPPWPSRIQGFCFQPMRADDDPTVGVLPTLEEIDADLKFIEGRSHAVRTYSVEGVLGQIPELAAKHDINVAVGAWIGPDAGKNEVEVTRLLELVPRQTNVVRVIVGNEVLLRGDVPVEQLAAYLDRARERFEVPVSTAEPWDVWLRHPELADHVDYLAVHLLPYWEGVWVGDAVDYIVEHVNQLKQAFPGKPIVLGEVGWPSNGRTRGGAVASRANEATFLRRFLDRARSENYVYYLMEAFDQPWKTNFEGAVGAYWGVWDVDRTTKFEFTAPIVEIPHWRTLAALSVIVAAIALALLLIDSRTLYARGRSFLALVASATATTAVWIGYDYSQQYLTPSSAAVGAVLLAGTALVLLLLLTEAHEWAEAVWVNARRRLPRPVPPLAGPPPLVSIHVPCHNEPPQLLVETLDALAALDYPNYEVLVIDNNTKDPGVWKPVEEHCLKLGSRFRFFHVDPLAGYKAGALNFALAHTHPDAQIVGVIDADYAVTPNWLRELVPQFGEPSVAIVQAPQDYRDGEENAFKAMCYAEYSGFFYFGMQTRNERNAIIQHGTMTLVRRDVLEEAQGWAEWCITEDAELGLRILAKGHQAIYVPASYGRGLMPDSFLAYKKQRSRWAYGAVRILRKHAGSLLNYKPTSLTFGQRYHFIVGWMPWFADAINVLTVCGAVAWSLAMVAAPGQIDPPRVEFSLLPIVFFAFRVAKTMYLYRGGSSATRRQTLAAALAGLALSHTIGMAVLNALVRSDRPFFRTPKCASTQPLAAALAATRGETFTLAMLWVAAFSVARWGGAGNIELMTFVGMLLVLSLPYLAALVVSLASASRLSASWVGRMDMVDAVDLAPARAAQESAPRPAYGS